MFTLGIIGLGAMGADMLEAAAGHPDFTVRVAADLRTDLVEQTRARYPDIACSTEPRDVLASDVDAVYVATPPATHADLVVAAFAAGKAVFCEKPLAVAGPDGDRMVTAAQVSGLANAVNFALADRAAVLEIGRALAAGDVGRVRAVEIRLVFPVWPRAFQAHATWLDGRAQGGFVREVLSHFAYVTDKLVGPIRTEYTHMEYAGPERSESTAIGLLYAGGVPVHVSGAAGLSGPEVYEWTLWGEHRSYRLTDWGTLSIWDGVAWATVDVPGPRGSEATRLSRFAAAMRGEPQPDLADFAAARRVQTVIESFHQDGS
ncbi:Gfo/Idh/MocA family protein [Hamadaea tsunoensis]|uniref:Gfo/Idh/MocA family protein n=1 Tax=Hamadaea tsunoensis TaxID=53368 RepID=UPI000423442C|nr:Gfo/Idh/MocA family oxidoreductase [Hamadaea tsunoensis]